MKSRNLFKLFLAVAIVASGFSMAEAKKRAKGKSRRATAGVTVNTISENKYAGEMTFNVFQASKKDSKVTVEYPVSGNAAAVSAIRKWICGEFSYPYSSTLTSAAPIIKKALAGVGPNRDVVELSQKISVIYSWENVITLQDEGYVYMGGAHGMPTVGQASFLLSDGTMLTAEMLPSIEKLRPYIIEAMMSEYGMSRSELKEMCFDNLDLPMGTPSVNAKGLHIQYQPYEIAPYSAGAPECTIPVEKIRSLLSAQALRFF